MALEGIVKRYPGVVANDGATLVVHPGRVHAVVGANGSGKSTLMKILCGLLRPDAGTIRVDGAAVRLASPHSALTMGIGMVPQHSLLAENLTVLENVIVGAEPRRRGCVDPGMARRRIEQLSSSFGFPVDPDRLVEHLGVGERQAVELVKALYRGGRVLILDEPTAVLAQRDARSLLAVLGKLSAQGLAVVLVSHRLDEVSAVADTITVMRAGRTIASLGGADADVSRLTELIAGGELAPAGPRRRAPAGTVALSVSGVGIIDGFGRALVSDMSFKVRRGEVLGIAGSTGDGRLELVEGLVGLRPLASGTITLEGRDITTWTTRARRAHGLGYVPEGSTA